MFEALVPKHRGGYEAREPIKFKMASVSVPFAEVNDSIGGRGPFYHDLRDSPVQKSFCLLKPEGVKRVADEALTAYFGNLGKSFKRVGPLYFRPAEHDASVAGRITIDGKEQNFALSRHAPNSVMKGETSLLLWQDYGRERRLIHAGHLATKELGIKDDHRLSVIPSSIPNYADFLSAQTGVVHTPRAYEAAKRIAILESKRRGNQTHPQFIWPTWTQFERPPLPLGQSYLDSQAYFVSSDPNPIRAVLNWQTGKFVKYEQQVDAAHLASGTERPPLFVFPS